MVAATDVVATVPPTPIAAGTPPIASEWRLFFTQLLTRTGGSSGSVTITSTQISDSTTVGRAVLTAPTAAAARLAIGAGTSDLTLGEVVATLNGDTGAITFAFDAGTGVFTTTIDPTGVVPGTYSGLTVGVDGRIVAAVEPTPPPALSAGYIDGLELSWNSASSITVGSGAAWIPSLANVVEVPASLTLSGITTVAGPAVWHVYLFESSGIPAIECGPTAPVSYFGKAYTKTGDNSRRYLGSVLALASGVVQFLQAGDTMRYMVYAGATPYRVVNSSTSATQASVNVSTLVPATLSSILMKAQNTVAPAALYAFNITASEATSAILISVNNNPSGFYAELPTRSPAVYYAMSSATGITSGGGYVDIVGYRYNR